LCDEPYWVTNEKWAVRRGEKGKKTRMKCRIFFFFASYFSLFTPYYFRPLPNFGRAFLNRPLLKLGYSVKGVS